MLPESRRNQPLQDDPIPGSRKIIQFLVSYRITLVVSGKILDVFAVERTTPCASPHSEAPITEPPHIATHACSFVGLANMPAERTEHLNFGGDGVSHKHVGVSRFCWRESHVVSVAQVGAETESTISRTPSGGSVRSSVDAVGREKGV